MFKYLLLIITIIAIYYLFRNKLKFIYNNVIKEIHTLLNDENNENDNNIIKKELSKNITTLFNLTKNNKNNTTENMKVNIIIYLHKIFPQLKNIELVNDFLYVNENNLIIFEPIIIKGNYNKKNIHIKLDLLFVNNTNDDIFIGSESLDNTNGSYNIIKLDIINYENENENKIVNNITNNIIENNIDDLIPNDIIITEYNKNKNNDSDIINDLITNDINITEYTKKTDSINDLIPNDIHLTEHEESSIDSLIKEQSEYNYI